jgi:hypothetical protein
MQIAVAGATGLVGRHVVASLTRRGHEPVPLARSAGVDLVTADGLDAALTGADAVIDVVNTEAADAESAERFFATATGNLIRGSPCRRRAPGRPLDRERRQDHGQPPLRRETKTGAGRARGRLPWSILRATRPARPRGHGAAP